MHLPDAVQRVAELAVGRPVTVIVAGKSYPLPIVPVPAPVALPDPMTTAARQLLESDAQGRAMLETVGKNFAEVFTRTERRIEAVAAGQEQIVQSVKELTGTLHLPVKPVYDKAGKLIGAERAKKLGA